MSMTKEEFQKQVKTSIRRDPWKNRYKNNPATIELKWDVATGSLGYEYEDNYYSYGNISTGELEPEFKEFDKILETLFCNEILYTEYKELCEEVMKITTEEESGYYGDFTVYVKKTVDLDKMFDFIVRMWGY